jgi:ATP-dependent DNA ligase
MLRTRPSKFALPIKADKVPVGPDWIHEIKYDGYRMMLIRKADSVRLVTKGGINWTDRFPLIVETARKLRTQHFVLDGETVVLRDDGVPDFAALHSGWHDKTAQFYAFDMLEGDGEDYRKLPLADRKANLARLLATSGAGIFLAQFEQGEIGPALFEQACKMGLEGLVSKHRARSYRAGNCKHWIKVKNRAHPAFARVKDQF